MRAKLDRVKNAQVSEACGHSLTRHSREQRVLR